MFSGEHQWEIWSYRVRVGENREIWVLGISEKRILEGGGMVVAQCSNLLGSLINPNCEMRQQTQNYPRKHISWNQGTRFLEEPQNKWWWLAWCQHLLHLFGMNWRGEAGVWQTWEQGNPKESSGTHRAGQLEIGSRKKNIGFSPIQ